MGFDLFTDFMSAMMPKFRSKDFINILSEYMHHLNTYDVTKVSKAHIHSTYIVLHYMLLRDGFSDYKRVVELHHKKYKQQSKKSYPFYISPIVKITKITDNSYPFIVRLNYLKLSQCLKLPINEKLALDCFKEIPNTQLDLSKPLLDNELLNALCNITHHMYACNIDWNGPDVFFECRKILYDCTVEYLKGIKLENVQKTAIIILDNPTTGSSDYKGALEMIMALYDENYIIDVVYTCNVDVEHISPIFNNKYTTNNFSHEWLVNTFKFQYTIALFATHAFYLETILAAANIGKHQIGMLCSLMSSGIPSITKFFMPTWDTPNNYIETPVYLPGMACTIPVPLLYSAKQNLDYNCNVTIGVALTGEKLNKNVGPLLKEISDRHPNITFNILMGNVADAPILDTALVMLHIDPYISNYNIQVNDRDKYYESINVCNFIICCDPYTSYISLCDFLAQSKPVVCLRNTLRNGSQCASRMLELLTKNTLSIANNITEYHAIIDRLCIDCSPDKYNIPNCQQLINIIDKHNHELRDAVKQYIKTIS